MEKVITENNIEEILAASQPVLVDFWAPWCGPCRVLSPTVDEIASEFDGRAVVAKCNVDDCEDIAARFGIRNIPTLMYFKNGELVDRSSGLVSKAEISSKLNSLL
ncbi:MAG: thioredoxin [Bacteroidales bacterium]|nr:thioredoxin [Bacteroidales bacterium]